MEKMVYSGRISVRSAANREMIDITGDVARVVTESGVAEGVALIFTMHTTTGLYINEPESGLVDDVQSVLERLVPRGGNYKHDRIDDNAAGHIQSLILSPSVAVPIEGGRLSLGTWQAVFVAECDGPRTRTVKVKIVGE
jgi:secondary thiamine-phosphate synthase enzyme